VVKVPIPKRKVQSSNFDSDCAVVEEPLVMWSQLR
jgi:hypothetical protein